MAPTPGPTPPPFALLLGLAQDAGVPQAGCDCGSCRGARADPARRRHAACLGLVAPGSGQAWLLDATPDIREQLAALAAAAPGCRLAGILLTHAHMGHYLGLAHLGREAMASRELPVYASAAVGAFLATNAPWSELLRLGHIALRPLSAERPLALAAGLAATPIAVPHRAELGDTHAFLVQGPRRRLFYCPDIDAWEAWDRDLASFVAGTDVALLDGTFFSADELGHRPMAEVPHPLVTDTARRLAGCRAEVALVHLNHSNPLLAEGPERAWLAAQGLAVAAEGARWDL